MIRHVPLGTKLSFGMGQAAESVKNFGFGTLLMLYYNQVLGLSGTYAGLAVFIALTVDAISDPAVGSWSDGIKSRWGRRHPFMVASVIPLGVTYYFLFVPPQGLTEWGLFLWFTTFSVLVRTALTFFHVPYLSLGAEMTQDYQERTHLVVVRMAFGFAASLVVIAVAWNYFFLKTADNPTPQLTQSPYFDYALLSSLVMMVMMLVCIWGTQEAIPTLAGANQAARRFSLGQVYRDLYDALGNHSFRVLFFSTLLFFVYAGTHTALSMHLKTFFWQLDTSAIQYWQYASVAGGIFGLPFAPLINRWVDKKWSVIIGCLGSALANTLPVLLALIGLMPEEPEVLVPLLVVFSFFSTMMVIQAGVTVPSMMGDIADEHELTHGARQEGIYFGSYNFSSKCTTALGNLVAGFALDLISFPVNSNPDSLDPKVISDFGVMYVGVSLILIFSTWVFWSYGLTRERHQQIMDSLAQGNSGGDRNPD
ncbi:MAG: MFS transporter [Gammaproteobacteria bacterium]|nr:MFS transporter [Gammaproteobacteria bacterium]